MEKRQDEEEIIKILNKKRCDLVFVKVPPFSAKVPLSCFNSFKNNGKKQLKVKTSKSQKKTIRTSSKEYTYIISRLTALINHPKLPSDYKKQYIKDRNYFKELNDPWENKSTMKLERIIKEQVYDLYKYISAKDPKALKEDRFKEVADIYNYYCKANICARNVKDIYWGKSNRLGKYI